MHLAAGSARTGPGANGRDAVGRRRVCESGAVAMRYSDSVAVCANTAPCCKHLVPFFFSYDVLVSDVGAKRSGVA